MLLGSQLLAALPGLTPWRPPSQSTLCCLCVCRYGELLLGMHHTLQATSEPEGEGEPAARCCCQETAASAGVC
jgi:hypothetical protein